MNEVNKVNESSRSCKALTLCRALRPGYNDPVKRKGPSLHPWQDERGEGLRGGGSEPSTRIIAERREFGNG